MKLSYGILKSKRFTFVNQRRFTLSNFLVILFGYQRLIDNYLVLFSTIVSVSCDRVAGQLNTKDTTQQIVATNNELTV